MKTESKCSAAIFAAISVVFIAGCATPPGPNQAGGTVIGGATGAVLGGALSRSPEGALVGGVIGALAGALIGEDIDATTRERVTQNESLRIEDIKALSVAGIEDDLIISQIKATRSAYRLDSAQILDLTKAGVSTRVIDYMINTREVATSSRTRSSFYLQFHPPYPPHHPPSPYRHHPGYGHPWHPPH
jgi:hypothetical protein